MAQSRHSGQAIATEAVHEASIALLLSKLVNIPFDQFASLKVLGKGYFGKVSKAIYHAPGSVDVFVAIKSLLDNEGSESELNARRKLLLQEATLMSFLEHPNIVHLLGVSTDGLDLHLIMEYCAHGELSLYLKENQNLAPEQLMSFSVGCASGLEYLSQKGVVHRDLAARNVLLDANLVCKVADYGMSRNIETKHYYRSIGGPVPVRWTAPEALEGQVFTEQTDVWSFGVLLYEIWSKGAVPYENMGERHVWVAVVGGFRLPCPKLCPPTVYALMRQCWRENGERPIFAEISIVLHALANPDKAISQLRGDSTTTLSGPAGRLQAYIASAANRVAGDDADEGDVFQAATAAPRKGEIPPSAELPLLQPPSPDQLTRRATGAATSSKQHSQATHSIEASLDATGDTEPAPSQQSDARVITTGSSSHKMPFGRGTLGSSSDTSSTPLTSGGRSIAVKTTSEQAHDTKRRGERESSV